MNRRSRKKKKPSVFDDLKNRISQLNIATLLSTKLSSIKSSPIKATSNKPRRSRLRSSDHRSSNHSSSSFKSNNNELLAFWGRLPKLHQRLLMIIAPLVLLLILLPAPSSDNKVLNNEGEQQVLSPERKEVAISTKSLSDQVPNQNPDTTPTTDTSSASWQEYIIQSGDTLTKVFRNNNLPISDLNELLSIEGQDKPLSKIKQGQLVRYKLTADGHLDILQLEKPDGAVIFLRLSDGSYGMSE